MINCLEYEHLWSQKYRPQSVQDVIVPQSIKTLFLSFLEQGEVPSLLLFDPVGGSGKSTIARALCNDLNIQPFILNGSLSTSIDNIRYDVTSYATSYSIDLNKKVVIIDEADRLSPQALDAIKALMEEVSSLCSFIFTCNNKNRFDAPLLSRFTVMDFIFTSAEKKEVKIGMCNRCLAILENENVTYDKKVIAEVVQRFSPNNRLILMKLQEYFNTYGKIDTGILAVIKGIDIDALIPILKAKKFTEAKQWVADNHEKLQDTFYNNIASKLEPHLSIAGNMQMYWHLSEEQKSHTVVPSKYVHFVGLIVKIMMDCEFL